MNKFIILFFVLLSIQSCNKDDEPRTSILGSWNCEEFSEIGQRNYQVSIIRNPYIPDATNEYIIYNFHNLGLTEATEVYVREIESGTLSITTPFPLGFTFNGKGIITSDFSRIEWDYTAYDAITNPVVKANYY